MVNELKFECVFFYAKCQIYTKSAQIFAKVTKLEKNSTLTRVGIQDSRLRKHSTPHNVVERVQFVFSKV